MTAVRIGLAALLLAAACLPTEAQAGTITLSDGAVVSMVNPEITGQEGYTDLTALGYDSVNNANGFGQVHFLGGTDVQIGVIKTDMTQPTCNPVGCGGVGSLDVEYQFVWDAGPGFAPDTTSTSATVTASDILNVTPVFGNAGGADAYMTISGINGTLYNQEDVLNNEIDGGLNTGPLSDLTITLYNSEVYTVEMGVSAEPGALGFSAFADIDPAISLGGSSGGHLDFSPGIGIGVPEPGSLSLLTVATVGLWWRRKNRVRRVTGGRGAALT